MTVKEFMKGKVVYNKDTQMFSINKPNNFNPTILQLRGWGFVRNISEDCHEASEFQDEIGEYIAQAINEKIERDGK